MCIVVQARVLSRFFLWNYHLSLYQRISDNIQLHFARPEERCSPISLIPFVIPLSTGTIKKLLLMKSTQLIKLINTDRSSIGNFRWRGENGQRGGYKRSHEKDMLDDLRNRINTLVSSYRWVRNRRTLFARNV